MILFSILKICRVFPSTTLSFEKTNHLNRKPQNRPFVQKKFFRQNSRIPSTLLNYTAGNQVFTCKIFSHASAEINGTRGWQRGNESISARTSLPGDGNLVLGARITRSAAITRELDPSTCVPPTSAAMHTKKDYYELRDGSTLLLNLLSSAFLPFICTTSCS